MLEKEEEFQFLENLKRITKGRILITTPNPSLGCTWREVPFGKRTYISLVSLGCGRF